MPKSNHATHPVNALCDVTSTIHSTGKNRARNLEFGDSRYDEKHKICGKKITEFSRALVQQWWRRAHQQTYTSILILHLGST